MAKAQIVVENGVVVFSPSLLQEFPEITATITGNVITVSNAWREDLISVTGDNVFWAEKQDFASFSIIFTNNNAKVNTLSNLIVRYVNFHNGDYSISTPKYVTTPELIADPLSLGVKPNYYGLLNQYANGSIAIEELSKTLAQMYRVVTPKTANEAVIAQVLGNISIEDMRLFLDSQLSAMDTYNTVKDNLSPELDGTGSKKYSLSTASKEVELVEKDGVVKVTKLCVRDGEDVSVLVPQVLENATSITQCMLKSISCEEFASSPFTVITTDFGIHANIQREGVNGASDSSIKIYYDDTTVTNNTDELGFIDVGIWSEFISELFIKSGSINLKYFYLHSMHSTWGTFGNPRYRKNIDIVMTGYNYPYMGADGIFVAIMSRVKDLVKEETITNPTACVSELKFGRVRTSTILPENLLMDAQEIVCFSNHEQFFDAPLVKSIYISNRGYFYNNGNVYISHAPDYGFMGTLLESKITKVVIKSQAEVYILMALGARLGFREMHYNENQQTAVGVRDGVGYGFKYFPIEDAMIDIIDAGIVQFEDMHEKTERFVSLYNKEVSVATITDGQLLICSFGEAIPEAGSYFVEGVETYAFNNGSGQYFAGARYGASLGKILLNGISITDKSTCLLEIMGEKPLLVSSSYSVREADLSFIQGIMNSLRTGYNGKFSLSPSDAEPDEDNNLFAYEMLGESYQKLLGSTNYQHTGSAYYNLLSIAQGGGVSLSKLENGSYMGLNISSVSLNLSLGGLSEAGSQVIKRTDNFDPVFGTLTLDCLTGQIDVVYGVVADALAYTQAQPQVGAFTADVLLHHVYENEVVSLYLYSIGIGDYQGYVNLRIVSVDLKNMVSHRTDAIATTIPDQNTVFSPPPPIPKEAGVAVTGNYVQYTITDNGDGSVTINYVAYDKDGNDITNQFKTLSIGDYFLHEDMQ